MCDYEPRAISPILLFAFGCFVVVGTPSDSFATGEPGLELRLDEAPLYGVVGEKLWFKCCFLNHSKKELKHVRVVLEGDGLPRIHWNLSGPIKGGEDWWLNKRNLFWIPKKPCEGSYVLRPECEALDGSITPARGEIVIDATHRNILDNKYYLDGPGTNHRMSCKWRDDLGKEHMLEMNGVCGNRQRRKRVRGVGRVVDGFSYDVTLRIDGNNVGNLADTKDWELRGVFTGDKSEHIDDWGSRKVFQKVTSGVSISCTLEKGDPNSSAREGHIVVSLLGGSQVHGDYPVLALEGAWKSEQPWRKLRKGMSTRDVQTLLGRPREKRGTKSTTFWVYGPGRDGTAQVRLESDRVVSWRREGLESPPDGRREKDQQQERRASGATLQETVAYIMRKLGENYQVYDTLRISVKEASSSYYDKAGKWHSTSGHKLNMYTNTDQVMVLLEALDRERVQVNGRQVVLHVINDELRMSLSTLGGDGRHTSDKVSRVDFTANNETDAGRIARAFRHLIELVSPQDERELFDQ